MSKGFLKYCVCLIFLCHTGMAGAQDTPERDIKFIRTIYKQINAQKDLRQQTLENEEVTDEIPDGGIAVTGYFKQKRILKIKVWAGLSYGTIQFEYFFDKDSLIFVYITEAHFEQIGDSIDHNKTNLKLEGRFYYKNDRLIFQTITGSGFWDDAEDAIMRLPEDAKKYLEMLYAKMK